MVRNLAIFQSSQRGQEASAGNNTVSVPLHLERLYKTKKNFVDKCKPKICYFKIKNLK